MLGTGGNELWEIGENGGEKRVEQCCSSGPLLVNRVEGAWDGVIKYAQRDVISNGGDDVEKEECDERDDGGGHGPKFRDQSGSYGNEKRSGEGDHALWFSKTREE